MPRKLFRLYDLMLDRVDLCGAGANPAANIVLFKSKEDNVPQPKKKAKAPAKKVKGKADARSKSKQRGDEDEEEDEDDDAVAKSEDDEDEDDDVDDEDDVEKSEDDEDDDAVADEDEEDEEPARPAKKKKLVKKQPKKVAKADDDEDEDDEDSFDDIDEDDDEEIDEAVLKSLPPAIRAQVERNTRIAKRAQEHARQATALVTAEKQRRERLEFIEKAKTTVPNLPGTPQEKGEILQAIYADAPLPKDIRKALMRLLKSGDAAMAIQFAETGRRTSDEDENDSPQGQLEAFAEDLMEKNDKLTKSAAFVKACEEHPKLYQQYRMAKNRAQRPDVN